MVSGQTNAFFVREGDRFMPTPHARGPWEPNSLHGRVVAGLIARTFEHRYGDESFHFARLTSDLFRLPPLGPLEIATELIREGNRIRVADGVVTCEGVEVARGRGVMLRKAEQPEGDVWSPPNWDAPLPDDVQPPERPGWGGVPIWETRPITGREFGGVEQKRAWLRETRALVEGEALTPFVRVAVAADFTNPFANSGSRGLSFVNADITIYLHRLPLAEWIGFEVASHQSAAGVAVGESTLYDVQGAIGKSIVCAVANQRRPMTPGPLP